MSGVQREGGGASGEAAGREGLPEIVSRLGGPIFVDMSPGRVRITCRGVTAVGPSRAAAIRELAHRLTAEPVGRIQRAGGGATGPTEGSG